MNLINLMNPINPKPQTLPAQALQIPIVGFILQPLREIEPTMERTRLKNQGFYFKISGFRRGFVGFRFQGVRQLLEGGPPCGVKV